MGRGKKDKDGGFWMMGNFVFLKWVWGKLLTFFVRFFENDDDRIGNEWFAIVNEGY